MWRRQRGEIKHDTKNALAEEDASISTVAKAVAIECTCQADFQARKRPKPWEEALPTGTDGRTKTLRDNVYTGLSAVLSPCTF